MNIASVTDNIISQYDCDAIVNSANSSMLAGSRDYVAIHKVAGKQLELSTKYVAPLKPSNVVLTKAFNLIYKYIIHVRIPKLYIDLNPDALLAQSRLNVSNIAEDNNIQRIALPAIGAGIHSFPIDHAMNIYSKIAISLRNTVTLKEIRFVFQSELEAKITSTRIQIYQQSILMKHWGKR